MMELHHLPQNSTSSGRGVETKSFKLQQIDDDKNTKKCLEHDSCAKPMNPKGEKMETCGLEGIKRSPTEPP